MRTVRFGRECAKGIAGTGCNYCTNCVVVDSYNRTVTCNVNAPKLVAVGIPAYERSVIVGSNRIHHPEFREVEKW